MIHDYRLKFVFKFYIISETRSSGEKIGNDIAYFTLCHYIAYTIKN